MNNHLEQLKPSADTIRLRDDERALLWQKLEVHMEEHPVRERFLMRQRIHLFMTHHPMPIAILTLAILLGGTTSVAAAGSLPGDALYGVKTEINEPVHGWFHFNAESKAEFEAKLGERRVHELERLKERGGMPSEEAREHIAQKASEHEARMNMLADKLEAKGNLEAATTIRTRVSAIAELHADIKARLETADTDEERQEIHEDIREEMKDLQDGMREEFDANRPNIDVEIDGELKTRIDSIELRAKMKEAFDARSQGLELETETEINL